MIEAEKITTPSGSPDGVKEGEIEFMLYGNDNTFYSSLYLATAYANGQTDETLTAISDEDYAEWFNPPDGKQGSWVNGIPVLTDIPKPDYAGFATTQRDSLIAEANAATYTSMLKLQVGRKLSEDESASVNAWLDYIDELNDLDLSVAPDINWPEKPE